MKKRLALSCAVVSAFSGNVAMAQQETVLIEPSIPFSYDKGRNVSVTEKPRTEYDAIGMALGSFELFPKIELGTGYSSNIYLTPDDEQDSALGVVAPSARLSSNWSRHSLVVGGGGRFVRYFGNSRRNEDNWNVRAAGRADLGSAYSVTLEGQASREQEEPFAAVTDVDVPSLSSFRRNYVSARGQYSEGRTRIIVTADVTTLRFNPIDLGSGSVLDQSDRDRDVKRITAQGEYALSPSVSAYVQGNYNRADYKQPVSTTLVYRDADGWRALAGLNIDFSGFLRGSVGVGYSRRNYDAAQFGTVGGFSAEGKLEYFPTELTTFTLGLRRVIEDASVGAVAAFFDNRASLRVDHELLYNLLLNARADITVQDFIDSSQKTRSWRLGGGAKYLVSPRMQILGDLNYGQRRSLNSVSMPGNRNEFRSAISVLLQI